MEEKQQQSIDLNTLDKAGLEALHRDMLAQIGALECQKVYVINLSAQVAGHIQAKHSNVPQQTAIAVPKLKKLELPSLGKKES